MSDWSHKSTEKDLKAVEIFSICDFDEFVENSEGMETFSLSQNR